MVGEAEITDTVKQMIAERIRESRAKQGRPPPEPAIEPWFTVDKQGKRTYRGFAIRLAGQGDEEARALGYDFAMPPWGWVRIKAHQLHAWWRTALRMPAVFEYLAPLAIAAGAVMVAVAYRLPATQCV